jgi:hypothetical protein
MDFAVVCIGALVGLGLVAAIAQKFQGGDDEIKVGHDCSNCTEAEEGSCKIHCLMEEQKEKAGHP